MQTRLNTTGVRSKEGPVTPAEAKARKAQKAIDRIVEIDRLETLIAFAKEDIKKFEGQGRYSGADIQRRLINLMSRKLNALELQK